MDKLDNLLNFKTTPPIQALNQGTTLARVLILGEFTIAEALKEGVAPEDIIDVIPETPEMSGKTFYVDADFRIQKDLLDDLVSKVNYKTLRNWFVVSILKPEEIRESFDTMANKIGIDPNELEEMGIGNWGRMRLPEEVRLPLLGLLSSMPQDQQSLATMQSILQDSIVNRLQDEHTKTYKPLMDNLNDENLYSAHMGSLRTARYVTRGVPYGVPLNPYEDPRNIEYNRVKRTVVEKSLNDLRDSLFKATQRK